MLYLPVYMPDDNHSKCYTTYKVKIEYPPRVKFLIVAYYKSKNNHLYYIEHYEECATRIIEVTALSNS